MNPRLKKILTSEQSEHLEAIEAHCDRGEYEQALKLVEARLEDPPQDREDLKNLVFQMELVGWLINIGGESIERAPLEQGVRLLEDHRALFEQITHPSGYEYCLGNGYFGLFDVEQTRPDFEFSPRAAKRTLLKAKTHYWRAYRAIEADGRYPPKAMPRLVVNLGNNLRTCGRIAEAIQCYDEVLAAYPTFTKAHLQRAFALLVLNQVSTTYTISLLEQSHRGYATALELGGLPLPSEEQVEQRIKGLEDELQEHGFDLKKAAQEHDETAREAAEHSDYRRFCIENHLTLSIHALYCNCAGARRDDLQIAKSTGGLAGDFVPQMELILNRLKSEFCTARLLFFQALSTQLSESLYPDEVTFTELHEGEHVGPRAELLRVSFRLCFGVLDKIARGICDLFDVADEQESLYFENFWNPRGKLSGKRERRWETLNNQKNWPLVALYSLAADLNSYGGEWGDLKDWRNLLEHEFLVIVDEEESDPYGVLESSIIETVDIESFRARTLHLLQLTRSAIINFALCVRTEGLKKEGNTPVLLEKKSQ